MSDALLHTLGIPFTIVTGTAAGLLALLSWAIFRESPFGTVVALISVTMSAIAIYHLVLITVGGEYVALEILRSTVYTVVAVTIYLAIRRHRRVSDGLAE